MTALEIRVRRVGEYATNAYGIVDPHTMRSVLVDPGAEPDALLRLLAGSVPAAIVVTHGHPDHIGALDEMRHHLGVPVLAHPGPRHDGRRLGVDRALRTGDSVALGSHTLSVVEAPGHAPDQLCLLLDGGGHAFVGDAVFAGGPGHTDSPADFRVTLRTLRHVVLAWPDTTVCHPGHGDPFTVGSIRNAVEEFLSREHGDFCGDATWDT